MNKTLLVILSLLKFAGSTIQPSNMSSQPGNTASQHSNTPSQPSHTSRQTSSNPAPTIKPPRQKADFSGLTGQVNEHILDIVQKSRLSEISKRLRQSLSIPSWRESSGRRQTTTASTLMNSTTTPAPVIEPFVAMANDAGYADSHIIEFNTERISMERKNPDIEITSVAVHIILRRYGRRRTSTVRSGGRRRYPGTCQPGNLTIKVRQVNSDGTPGRKLSAKRLPFNCKRRKPIIPIDIDPKIFQDTINGGQRNILMHINCNGCKKKAKIAFPRRKCRACRQKTQVRSSRRSGKTRKRRRNRHAKRNVGFSMKDKPLLILYRKVLSPVKSHVRSTRSPGKCHVSRRSTRRRNQQRARAPVCNAQRTCCKYSMIVDLLSLEFGGNIVAPSTYRDQYCLGLCSLTSPDSSAVNIVYGNGTSVPVRQCEATRTQDLTVLYMDNERRITIGKVRNLIATRCRCPRLLRIETL